MSSECSTRRMTYQKSSSRRKRTERLAMDRPAVHYAFLFTAAHHYLLRRKSNADVTMRVMSHSYERHIIFTPRSGYLWSILCLNDRSDIIMCLWCHNELLHRGWRHSDPDQEVFSLYLHLLQLPWFASHGLEQSSSYSNSLNNVGMQVGMTALVLVMRMSLESCVLLMWQVILTVGKKDFHHHEHNQLFSRHNAMTVSSIVAWLSFYKRNLLRAEQSILYFVMILY